MNYFKQQDFDIFKNGGEPRNTTLENNYKATIGKFNDLVDKIKNKLGDSYGCDYKNICLTTPGIHTEQKLIDYKWAKFYMKNYQGVIDPDKKKIKTQNVFGLSIGKEGLSIRIDINRMQVPQLINNQEAVLKAIHDKTEVNINNADEETLVDTICQYITSHENDYLENGAMLGINECIKKRNMNILKDLLLKNKNLILTGAPGTGKTYLAKEIAKEITRDCDDNNPPQYEMIQFHPSYDYSDFVEGLRPVKDKNGNIGFERKDGVFKAFCEKALKAYNKYNDEKDKEKKNAPKYVFIIDEINRGEISKIFGELFFSIDPGYRGANGAIMTQYANLNEKPNVFDEALGIKEEKDDKDAFGHFFVPENVYIIGTMNDIDRSVESMDFAMRRRFAFKEIKADERTDMWSGEIDSDKLQQAEKCMKSLNSAIEKIPGLNSAYHIGPSYFLKLKDNGGKFDDLWETYFKGLLFEYLRGMPDAENYLKELKIYYDNKEVKNKQSEEQEAK